MSKKYDIALRKDDKGRLDDVVVNDVETFRMEFMSKNDIWLRCYLKNGKFIDFGISGKRLSLRSDCEPEGVVYE